MPTREEATYGYNYGIPVVDYGDAAYVPYYSDGTLKSDNGYVPYISETPVNGAVETQWDEEWNLEGYADVSGKVCTGTLVGENYVEISPQLAHGFTVRSPHKRVVFCLYDEDHAEMGKMVVYQATESIIIPPKNARYMRVIVEEYGNALESNVLVIPLQEEDISTLSEESINNFESFLGGR